jgi:hypothetical protein
MSPSAFLSAVGERVALQMLVKSLRERISRLEAILATLNTQLGEAEDKLALCTEDED